METITAAEAALHLSELLNHVKHQGESFEVARDNEVVARLVPATPPGSVPLAELDQLFASVPRLDEDDVEAFENEVRAIRDNLSVPVSKWE